MATGAGTSEAAGVTAVVDRQESHILLGLPVDSVSRSVTLLFVRYSLILTVYECHHFVQH